MQPVPELVQHFLGHFRCSYLNKESLNIPGHDTKIPGANGWKANNISLGDGKTYDYIAIYFKDGIFNKTGDFWISNVTPEKVEFKDDACISCPEESQDWYPTYRNQGVTIQTSNPELSNYLFDLSLQDEISNLIEKLKTVTDVDDKLDAIRSFSLCSYTKLTKELRIKLIEEIADVWVNISEEDELILVNLIETTPTADIDFILTELQGRKVLETIYNGTHNYGGLDNFTRLIYQLSVLAKNNPNRKIKSDQIYVWNRNWFGREEVYDVKFNTDNFITITPDGNYLKAHDIASFTFIPVRYNRETKYLLPLDENKEQITLVPAMYFKALHTSRITDITTTSLEIGIDAASLCLGIGKLKTAERFLKAIGIADVALIASNVGVNIARDEIEQLEGGNEFLSSWDKFQMLMSLAIFSTQQIEKEYDLISDFSASYRNLQKKYIDAPNELAKAFGNGDITTGKTQIKKLNQLADKAEDALKN